MNKEEFSNNSAQEESGARVAEKIEYNTADKAEQTEEKQIPAEEINNAEEAPHVSYDEADDEAAKKGSNAPVTKEGVLPFAEDGAELSEKESEAPFPTVGASEVGDDPDAEENIFPDGEESGTDGALSDDGAPAITAAEETVFVTDDIEVKPISSSVENHTEADTQEDAEDELFSSDTQEQDESEDEDGGDTEEPVEDENDYAGGSVEKKEKNRVIDTVFDIMEIVIFSLVAVLLITTFVFRHSVVDGSSMEQTLYDGEHLIISNLFYTPKRNDIIVCEDYSTSLRKPIVKRVIAVAGDHIVINVYGEVFINGDPEPLDEDYVYIDGLDSHRHVIDMIVPEGEIFVMGDHRNVSSDSRDIGTVSVDSVLGKVLFRFYPLDRFGTVK